MAEAAFDIARVLYALSGWDGVVEWFADRPVARDNYPGYTLGYLLRKLASLDVAINYDRGRDAWHCRAGGIIQAAATPEDAAALLCIQLLKRGKCERHVNGCVGQQSE